MSTLPSLPQAGLHLDIRLPRLEEAALLLDLDGTLLDIAPTPDGVVVPDGLIDRLLTWRCRLGGALAVVTGRPIEQVDELLPNVPSAVAGEHGGAIRHRPDGPIERAFLPVPDPDWFAMAETIAHRHPGALLEVKRRGFALHYRAAPEAGPALHEALAAMLAPRAGEFALLAAHMAWEVRPVGADKGTAVARLMERPPFEGRKPVFIGDDVTDRDGIAEAQRRGGAGLWVPDVFGNAAGVRAWLS